jgi:hypothetical protein
MYFDLTDLDQLQEIRFVEKINHVCVEDGYYKVFYNRRTDEFLLVKINTVIK